MLLTELRVLLVDTGRLFWRLLPQILAIYLLGWLGAQLALKVAVQVADWNVWIGLVIFAFSFLSRLVAIVLILRLAGRELGIWSMIPEEEAVGDRRDESLTQLLAVTLLPFLGLYAAFGQVNEAANQITTEQAFRGGAFAERTILGVLNEAATVHLWGFLALLVGLYVLRRVLDIVHERTGIRFFGIVVALVESFFLLLVILGGVRIWQQARLWLSNRAVAGWLDAVRLAVLDALSVISVRLPELAVRLAEFLRDQVWPLFWEVLSQPIIWLAVAALVYGSQVLSLAELWRKGEPVRARIPGSTVFARHRDKLAARRPGPPPAGVRRVAGEVREAFLGDIDDKYLPTFHSIRLVLRAGVSFLVAFVVAYTLVEVVTNYVGYVVKLVLGGHEASFWFQYGPYLDIVYEVPWEPLRLCLLAVAFRRCLRVFQDRAGPAAEFAPSAAPAAEPAR